MEAGEATPAGSTIRSSTNGPCSEGINDSLEEMDGILRLLKGRFAVMNLIPYNSMDGDAYRRPSGERIVELVRYLHSRGVLTKVRNSAGQDIDGGCGQLRARATQGTVERRIPPARPEATLLPPKGPRLSGQVWKRRTTDGYRDGRTEPEAADLLADAA